MSLSESEMLARFDELWDKITFIAETPSDRKVWEVDDEQMTEVEFMKKYVKERQS